MSRCRFSFGNFQTLTLDVREFTMQGALGGYHGMFHMDLQAMERVQDGPLAYNSVRAEVKTADGLLVGFAAQPLGQGVIPVYDHSNTDQAMVEMTLTGQQVEALEDHRSGGDMNLRLRLEVTAQMPNKAPERRVEEVVFNIPQSAWLRILDNSGFSETLLLEVPLLEGAAKGALQNLLSAQTAMRTGRFRECVALCRQALEAAAALAQYEVKGGRTVRDGLTALLQDNAWDQKARYRMIFGTLWVFASTEHHEDGEARHHEVSRPDAVMMLTMTAAALARLAAGELPK